MDLEDMGAVFYWTRYSKKMGEKIEKPRAVGFFTEFHAQEKGLRLVVGKEGRVLEGNAVSLYWLVDEADGIIADAKFQVFGESALIAAAEGACELLIHKNYDQAKRITADLIDKQLRDRQEKAAFPPETGGLLNLVLDAIEKAAACCEDLPLPQNYLSPVPRHMENNEEGGYPNFLEFPRATKLSLIEEVLNKEVRPYIELDEGGIEVVDLVNDRELMISYKGNCTSCFSAIGATLSTIQHIVQTKIHPSLVVVPNMDELKF